MNHILAFLIVTFCFYSCSKETPQPIPETASEQQGKKIVVPKFDGATAFQYLTAQTNFGPRNPGSDGHRNCLNYLFTELRQYADAVNLQPFTIVGYDKEIIKMNNIIASFNSQATSRILLIAHWDTRPWADEEPNSNRAGQPIIGANDGASGVAVLLEIARHLKSTPPSIGVDMLFTDGEDYGKEGDKDGYVHGARYFANNLPQGFTPMFGILIDMVGDAKLELLKERYSVMYAGDIVDQVWATAKELNVSQFSDNFQGFVTDDHLPLNKVGIKTIDLIDFDYPDTSNRYWHTLQDTPDKCSPESLEAVGMVIMHVIYHQTL